MLLDLAAFSNVQQNANMGFTGNHQIKNMITGKESNTQFNDHKGGQASQVGNLTQNGNMQIAGNHQFENFTNNGNTQVMPRTFNPDGSPAQLMLMDLANFNNFQNMEGGNASFQGTHAIKNMKNMKGGNVAFLDHKSGQASTVGNFDNAGNAKINGNHNFDNTTNSGQLVAGARTFNPDGSPAQLVLMDLANFNNFQNNEGGNASFQGTHGIKNLNNAKGANVAFLDHKSGQASTVGNFNNAGNAKVNGNHNFDNTTNSGQLVAGARTFNPDGSPAQLMLMDLATFNTFNNAAGGQASFTGTHAIKKLNNAEKGNIMFNDHKSGQHSTVGETNNAGMMKISGNHAFDKFNNMGTGKAEVMARQFDDKGNKVALLLI